MRTRRTELTRKTNETEISLVLDLDGTGRVKIGTGLGFLDHMLHALGKHGGFDLSLTCRGDVEIDDHHTVEDCAIVLGQAFDEALGDRAGVARFGDAFVAMDEALARAVVDLSGRGLACVDLGLRRERLGSVACENLTHFIQTLARESRSTVHVDLLKGENDHHRAEAAFKSLALALRQAVSRGDTEVVPSTKGVLA